MASHIDFLISTGATITTLMEHDAKRLGLDTHSMEFKPTEYRPGQMIEATTAPAKIAFLPPYGKPYYQTITLHVAKPNEEHAKLPSILGTNALRNMQLEIGHDHVRISPSTGP